MRLNRKPYIDVQNLIPRHGEFSYRAHKHSQKKAVSSMKIVFLVSGDGTIPTGGNRIIYEHANRLCERGYSVELHHFEFFPSDRLLNLPRLMLQWLRRRLARRGKVHWFSFHEKIVRKHRFFAKLPACSPNTRMVATLFKTHDLFDPNSLSPKTCFYLIQGFNTQFSTKEALYAHWRSQSRNIVISKWLFRLVSEVAGEPAFVPNAIDRDFFKPTCPTDTAGPPIVLFASMSNHRKGSSEVVQALNTLAAKGLKFRVVTFGNQDPSAFGLCGPYEHHHLPSQSQLRDLYSAASIYASGSKAEGWGLTLAEATACGTALAVSDAEGHFEFARPEVSALFHERGDHEKLGANIETLLGDSELRARMVEAAREDLAPYNWDNAADHMEKALGLDCQGSSEAKANP